MAGFKLQNQLADHYLQCGYLRKEPTLFVRDTWNIELMFEMSCPVPGETIRVFWKDGEKILEGKVEEIKVDDRHYVYKTVLGPLSEGQHIYQIGVVNEAESTTRLLRQYSLTHPKGNNSTLRIAAVSDNQFGLKTYSRVLREVVRHQHIDYMLHAGDAVQDFENLQQWQTDFFAPLAHVGLGQRVPLIYAHGNHDQDPDWIYAYTRSSTIPREPWYAFTMGGNPDGTGGMRWIVLDSNIDSPAQDKFLAQELASPASRRATFRIVVTHIPPYIEFWDPETWFNQGESSWGQFVRDRFVPMFEEHGVDLVISGHQHNYQRGQRNGIMYAIIGGAGGTLDFDRVQNWGMYEVTEAAFHYVILEMEPKDNTLRWRTFEVDGDIIDEFILSAKEEERSSSPN
ncbi:uncharacterized protein VTP21DRAFT_7588 [Calcarisporiella thermophila]|uniref:uncharacterized protein n=1 Tax=Calcarisporiella thermophila TaxID=911321 RepID=UPI0037430F35